MSAVTDAALDVRGLRAGYGRREVVHGISFRVDAGGISLLLGPNGAGKSTTLGAIVGRVQRMAGEVQYEGTIVGPWTPAEAAAAGIQLVPEGGRVFRDLSVADNLRLGAFSVPGRFRPAQMDPVFEIFPKLRERLTQKGGTLSGGERQMLAIGRALMARPRLLLLDEPFLGLAPIVVDDVVAAVRRINTELGIALLIVEQNVKALALADRAYVLSLGDLAVETTDPLSLLGDGGARVQEGFFASTAQTGERE